jgi:hypothetical protein
MFVSFLNLIANIFNLMFQNITLGLKLATKKVLEAIP